MPTINPHIHFNGNAEQAFLWYQSIFGGQFTHLMRYSDLPETGMTIPPEEANNILHIRLPLGPGNALMGGDAFSALGRVEETSNRHTIFLTVDSEAEADRIFHALSAEGIVEVPMAVGPSGNYFGMCADRFGVQWMVEFAQ